MKKYFDLYQFVYWPEHSFTLAFIKGNPTKQPAAFHLIYKWSLWLGWFEIRKFLTDDQREDALRIYITNEQ
jgi:hypothetical protein